MERGPEPLGRYLGKLQGIGPCFFSPSPLPTPLGDTWLWGLRWGPAQLASLPTHSGTQPGFLEGGGRLGFGLGWRLRGMGFAVCSGLTLEQRALAVLSLCLMPP